MQRQDDVLAVRQVATHPLDRVGVHVGCRHLDRRGQIDDDLPVGGGLEDLDDLVADVHGEVELGAGVALRRVLVEHLRVRNRALHASAQPRPFEGDVDDSLPIGSEHDLALQHARRVVEVNDRLLRAADRLVGALDEVLPRLGEHLDGDVVGNEIRFDQLPHEIEVGLAGRGESDLDLLVAHLHQQLEHEPFALGAHRIDERLVAVAQVDRAPARRLRDPPGRPGAVGQVDGDLLVEGAVLVHRHPGRLLRVLHGRFFVSSEDGETPGP